MIKQIIIKLTFTFNHTIQISETFCMSFPNVGDQSMGWFCNLTQHSDFVWVISP